METLNQTKPSREGRKRTREAERPVEDAGENVGAPSNLRRESMSPKRYVCHMALMTKLV